MIQLTGKKLVITGANGGIGREIAARALLSGAQLCLLEKSADLSDAAQAAAYDAVRSYSGSEVSPSDRDNIIATLDTNCFAIPADLTSEIETQKALDQAADKMGGLNSLINNAATLLGDDSTPVGTSLETWNQTLAVNLTGSFLTCRAALPHMLKAGSGAIVNLSSVVAHAASANAQIAYTTSKGGLEAMTREIAMIYARDNIRANCVAPGPVLTERTQHYFDTPEKWQSRRQHIPLGRLGKREEIAALVLFLISDLSGFTTGSTYLADGGISTAYLIDDRNGTQQP
ncbi:SDR family oxidoreductase [Alphaproteobacteria bacterium]|jgi:NAD(P)-dependent dehydrogenase (short-subunit alcohol dehydrogenase family)|nr:SDR family oxidoreductase [Alphaproteobacteria bacterium]